MINIKIISFSHWDLSSNMGKCFWRNVLKWAHHFECTISSLCIIVYSCPITKNWSLPFAELWPAECRGRWSLLKQAAAAFTAASKAAAPRSTNAQNAIDAHLRIMLSLYSVQPGTMPLIPLTQERTSTTSCCDFQNRQSCQLQNKNWQAADKTGPSMLC